MIKAGARARAAAFFLRKLQLIAAHPPVSSDQSGTVTREIVSAAHVARPAAGIVELARASYLALSSQYLSTSFRVAML